MKGKLKNRQNPKIVDGNSLCLKAPKDKPSNHSWRSSEPFEENDKLMVQYYCLWCHNTSPKMEYIPDDDCRGSCG